MQGWEGMFAAMILGQVILWGLIVYGLWKWLGPIGICI